MERKRTKSRTSVRRSADRRRALLRQASWHPKQENGAEAGALEVSRFPPGFDSSGCCPGATSFGSLHLCRMISSRGRRCYVYVRCANAAILGLRLTLTWGFLKENVKHIPENNGENFSGVVSKRSRELMVVWKRPQAFT